MDGEAAILPVEICLTQSRLSLWSPQAQLEGSICALADGDCRFDVVSPGTRMLGNGGVPCGSKLCHGRHGQHQHCVEQRVPRNQIRRDSPSEGACLSITCMASHAVHQIGTSKTAPAPGHRPMRVLLWGSLQRSQQKAWSEATQGLRKGGGIRRCLTIVSPGEVQCGRSRLVGRHGSAKD